MDSNEAMPRSIVTSRVGADDDGMVQAVALLFRVFARCFGTKWRATFEDAQAPTVWERKFRAAGLDAERIRAAIGPATNLGFPPSTGEFIALCRPPAPGVDAALREALGWHPDRELTWSHPAIGATAREVGHWRLHALDDRQLRPLFGSVYAQMLDRFACGQSLDLPVVRALPAEIRTPIPPGAATPPTVASAIAEAARLLGFPHG